MTFIKKIRKEKSEKEIIEEQEEIKPEIIEQSFIPALLEVLKSNIERNCKTGRESFTKNKDAALW